MLKITDTIHIADDELEFECVCSSGPGGQHVNKVSTAVKLYFDITNSPSIPVEVKRRGISLAGKRVSGDGILIIDARRFRSQQQNKRDAVERLQLLLIAAAKKPKPRISTKPTRRSQQKRLSGKKLHSIKKKQRKIEDRQDL